MSTTDHTSDPMGDDLDELLDAALDAAEDVNRADRFDSQRFASLPVILPDLRPAERQRFTRGPTMNDLTDEQRARALELYRLYPPVRVAPDHQETGTAHSRDDLMR